MLNCKGLRTIPAFNDLIYYLEHDQDLINYPNRIATTIMKEMHNEFKDTYESNSVNIIDMINTNNSTQTDFNRNNGMNVNLKDFKENMRQN